MSSNTLRLSRINRLIGSETYILLPNKPLTYTPIGYIHLEKQLKKKVEKNMTHAECKDATHPSHEPLLPRLNRIAGQVEGVKRMMNDRRYCPDILTQLHAVRAAIRNLELHILDTHISHCVAETLEMKSESKRRQKIDEIRDIIKRFE